MKFSNMCEINPKTLSHTETKTWYDNATDPPPTLTTGLI